MLHAAANLVALDHNPVQAHCVGVGLLVGAVLRIAVAGGQVQGLDARQFLDQGQPEFTEHVLHRIGTAHTDGGATLAGKVAAGELCVGVQAALFLAAFNAEGQAGAGSGGGQLHPIGAQIDRTAGGIDQLRREAALEARGVQVVDGSRCHAIGREDVVGHAVRVRAVHHRLAHRRGRSAHHVQRALCPDDGHVVVVLLLVDDLADLRRQVVAPRAVVALDAKDRAEHGVADVVAARATFNVAAADVHVDGRGGAWGDAQSRLHGRSDQRVLSRELVRVAKEQTAGGDLGHGVVVHEVEFGVHLGQVADLVVGVRSGCVPVIGTLEIVQRPKVEGVPGAHVWTHAAVRGERGTAQNGARLLVECCETARERGAGAGAGKARSIGGGQTQRAVREVTLGLQHCGLLAVAQEQRGVALVTGEVGTHRDAQVGDTTVAPHVAGGRDAASHAGIIHVALLLVVIAAAAGQDLNAFKTVVHDKVDHAGHGVRAVHGGRATRQHIHPLDQRGGNLIQVSWDVVWIASGQSAAVDQHQSARRPEAAQVNRGSACGPVGNLGTVPGEDLRHAVQQLFNVGEARDLDGLGAERNDGRRRVGGQRLDARTRDFDALAGLRKRRQAGQHGTATQGHQHPGTDF